MNEFRFKQFSVSQEHAAMKVGTDSDLLGTLAHGGRRVLDIGTGTGVLSLMMAQRFTGAHITAVEIDGDAVIDARHNFAASPWSDRLRLVHQSFQDFAVQQPEGSFDAIVCNPPYFDRSLQCDNPARNRARHTSSLPFGTLIEGVVRLLTEQGVFSVILPPEVYGLFDGDSIMAGLWQKARYEIHTMPDRPGKRYVIVYSRSRGDQPQIENCCMHNPDRTPSAWYKELMGEFLVGAAH